MHPGAEQQSDKLPGITAVLASNAGPTELEAAVLDLAAVLDGLVCGSFEIMVVNATPHVDDSLTDLRVRYPMLRWRLQGRSPVGEEAALAAGFDAATYDLILVSGTNGEIDVRETNHLLEAIERGADLAIGYRPRRADGLARRLSGWGWNALLGLLFGRTARDVNCPFKLFRTAVWQHVDVHPREATLTFNAELLVRARRLGFQVAEVPVSHRRPRHGTPRRAAGMAAIGRALVELGELRSRGLSGQVNRLTPERAFPRDARFPRPEPGPRAHSENEAVADR